MYTDFLYIFKDYFKSLKWYHITFDLALPALLCVIIALFGDRGEAYIIVQKAIGILSSLLGFTLAALALFLTGNTKVEELKGVKATDLEISGHPVSLYQLVVSYFSCALLEELLLCLAYLVGAFFPIIENAILTQSMNLIFLFVFFHVLFLSARAITCIYLTLTSQ